MYFNVTLKLTYHEGWDSYGTEATTITWEVTIEASTKELAIQEAEQRVWRYMRDNFPNPVGATAEKCEETPVKNPNFLAGF